MADELKNNQTVRENRVSLAVTALEAGVAPLKAAQFGSRTADAIKETINTPLDPVADKGLVNVGAVVTATMRDAGNGKLSDVLIEADAKGKIERTNFADASNNLKDMIREAVEGVNKMPAKDIANYAYAVEPKVTASVTNEVSVKGR